MLTVWTENSSSKFNKLPSIETASILCHSQGSLAAFSTKIAPLFVAADMHKSWGISLLHKHWPLGEDEICLQQKFDTPDGPEYISLPKYRYAGDCWPSIVQMDLKSDYLTMYGLEYSADILVEKAFKKLKNDENFVRDVSRAMANSALTEHFGLSVIRDASVIGHEIVEYNYNERISILREMVSGRFGDNSIQTSWRFDVDPCRAPAVMTYCWARCILPANGGPHYGDHPNLPDTLGLN